ncbi:LOW QUALITY PROTEIN: uncharacterized protein O3C94_007158 [Discoglossus pictus]
MEMETSHLANVKELILTDPDITLYVDGSRYADEHGKYHTGYAVTTEKDVIQASSLPPSMSAQEAELIALTKACEAAAGIRANIYTDSRYALGVTQDFGIIWSARGFMTAAGTPVKHKKAIRELLEALTLPKELAILKVKAHGKLNSDEARGNHLADQAAKQAAMKSQEMERREVDGHINIYTMQTLPTDLKLLKELQKTAGLEEVNKWKAKGAALKDGLYVDNLRFCLPRSLYPATVQWAHGPAHLSKTLLNTLINHLPLGKVDNLKEELVALLGSRRVTLRWLQSIQGKLNCACLIMPMGRIFSRRFALAMKGITQQHQFIWVFALMKDDIRVWLSFFSTFNGRTLIYPRRLSNDDLQLYTDASVACGFGAYLTVIQVVGARGGAAGRQDPGGAFQVWSTKVARLMWSSEAPATWNVYKKIWLKWSELVELAGGAGMEEMMLLGLDWAEFSNPSFRIGAAPVAGGLGLPEKVVKRIGRWESGHFQRLKNKKDKAGG